MKNLIYMLLCIGLLTGCGFSGNISGSADPSPRLPEVQNPPVADPQPNTEEPAAPVTEEPEPEPELTQDYYMNANYFLKPKDENGDRNVVLLTFDDGPKDAEVLHSMLDTLDRFEAKAIFFINGYRAVKQPELVELMHSRGHAIGNHSWDHIDLKKQDEAEVKRQIGDVQKLVEEITGEAPLFFRPPFGSGGDVVKAAAKEAGMLFMTWSNGSRDWMNGYDEPDKVIESVLEQLHPGSNILMHELPWTAEALERLLTSLQEKGYSFLQPQRIDPDYSKM